MEILILIIGLSVFFENGSENLDTVVKDVKKIDSKIQAQNKPPLKFEIINKNGTWVFAPIANNKQKTLIKTQGSSKFITLPDGSKIEKGL
ncbi:MAG: hypothetical protein H0A76_08330 [Candidatus Thiodubiliella endoseptemdiera]|uniref:Uncharacterized protein n=1 Tax=Candidatus Thiodubiliella endoseptemdiera TaxID=2738886 RepID=A0A853F6Q2_9GAMM|nr:hypothetical protein [Candidatus Thiodubiliella endoseptemdiera]